MASKLTIVDVLLALDSSLPGEIWNSMMRTWCHQRTGNTLTLEESSVSGTMAAHPRVNVAPQAAHDDYCEQQKGKPTASHCGDCCHATRNTRHYQQGQDLFCFLISCFFFFISFVEVFDSFLFLRADTQSLVIFCLKRAPSFSWYSPAGSMFLLLLVIYLFFFLSYLKSEIKSGKTKQQNN